MILVAGLVDRAGRTKKNTNNALKVLLPKVTSFEYNVSKILSPIVIK